MEKKKVKTNYKIVAIAFILIGVASIVLGVLMDSFLESTDSSNNKPSEIIEEVDKTKTEEIEISLEIDEAKKIIEIAKRLPISKENLYKNTQYNYNEINNYDLIASGLALIEDKYINYCTIEGTVSLPLEELNKNLTNYLENKEITLDNIKSLEKNSSYPAADYEVNDYGIKLKEDKIYIIGPCGGIFMAEDFIETKIEKVTQKDNYVYVYEKQAFASYEETDDIYSGNLSAHYYKDYAKKTEKLETLPHNYDNMVKPNWSLYDTYKYTLKKHSNGYYLEKFELVK